MLLAVTRIDTTIQQNVTDALRISERFSAVAKKRFCTGACHEK